MEMGKKSTCFGIAISPFKLNYFLNTFFGVFRGKLSLGATLEPLKESVMQ